MSKKINFINDRAGLRPASKTSSGPNSSRARLKLKEGKEVKCYVLLFCLDSGCVCVFFALSLVS